LGKYPVVGYLYPKEGKPKLKAWTIQGIYNTTVGTKTLYNLVEVVE
jgi:hypothetical protein